MKSTQLVIIYIVSAFLSFFLSGCGGTHHEQLTDGEAYTADSAMSIYGNNPQRALLIIDSAVIVGNLDEDDASFFRAKVYSQSVAQHRKDTAWMICEKLMVSDYVEDLDKKINVLDLLISIAHNQHNYEQCLRWSRVKATSCRQQGEETEALRTEAEIGWLLAKLGEEKKALEKLDAIIEKLDGQQSVNEMDACLIALKRKIAVLQSLDRDEDVIPLACRIIDITKDYREHYDSYSNNSYRLLSNEDDIVNYCDFYAAQAIGYLAHSYAVLGSGGTPNNHNIKKSREFLHLFEQSSYGQSLNGRKAIAPTWGLLGDYDKMLAVYDEVETQMADDTLNFDYFDILRGRAEVASVKNNPYAAIDYWRRYAKLGFYLNDLVLKGHAHEYAARYHLEEERINTERERNAKHTMVYVIVSLVFVILIVVAFILVQMRNMRLIREKNVALTKDIKERIAYQERYLQMYGEIHSPSTIASGDEQKEDAGYQPLSDDYQPPTTNPDQMSDKELFDYIRYIIAKDSLHLDPNFGRMQLMERLHMSKDRIGAAFAQGSEYGNISNFLNDARLFHSTKLLTEHPEMPIAEVALASGFSNRVVFSRNFKERFAMTPSEFRNKN